MKQMIPYGTQWIDDDDVHSVTEVLQSDWLTQGPKIKEFDNYEAIFELLMSSSPRGQNMSQN